MPRAQQKHAIWSGYETLTKGLKLSHDEAMERLEAAFVGLPVETVIQAKGDLVETFRLLTGEEPAPYANGGLPDARTLRRQIVEAATTGQPEAQQAPDPNDFNQMIRDRAAGLDRSVTVDSSDPAAAYDPEQDFLRQRFAERS